MSNLKMDSLEDLPNDFKYAKVLGYPSKELIEIAKSFKGIDYTDSSLTHENNFQGYKKHESNKTWEYASSACWQAIKSLFSDSGMTNKKHFFQSFIGSIGNNAKAIAVNEDNFNTILKASDLILKPIEDKLKEMSGLKEIPEEFKGIIDFAKKKDLNERHGINVSGNNNYFYLTFIYDLPHLKSENKDAFDKLSALRDDLLEEFEDENGDEDYAEKANDYFYFLYPYMRMCLVRSFGSVQYDGFWESFFWLVRNFPKRPIYVLLNTALLRKKGKKSGYYHLPDGSFLSKKMKGNYGIEPHVINHKISPFIIPSEIKERYEKEWNLKKMYSYSKGANFIGNLSANLNSRAEEMMSVISARIAQKKIKYPKRALAEIMMFDYIEFLDQYGKEIFEGTSTDEELNSYIPKDKVPFTGKKEELRRKKLFNKMVDVYESI